MLSQYGDLIAVLARKVEWMILGGGSIGYLVSTKIQDRPILKLSSDSVLTFGDASYLLAMAVAVVSIWKIVMATKEHEASTKKHEASTKEHELKSELLALQIKEIEDKE